uniref:Protein zyg-11 homolog n=1 Tax=Poecilia reticulata TaxID=8081 RepID=A0A3P9N8Y9_POERE
MDGKGPQTLCDLCLAQELADQLLQKMVTKGMLNDTTVGIFRNSEKLRLRSASIRYCKVSAMAFRLALCPHRLLELDASWVPGGLTGADVISGLASNPDCRASLQMLALNGLSLNLESPEEDSGVFIGFSSLQGLKTIHLVNTDLTDDVLEDICTLPRLETLDISCSSVTELNALLKCKNTLRSLIAHRLYRLDTTPVRLLFIFTQLHALRHLDISYNHFANDDSERRTNGDETVRQLLEAGPQILPSLVSLDISGRKTIDDSALRGFVESRSGLVFLGLLATGLSSSPVLSSHENLKVTGEANEKQLWEALRRYRERECFVKEALIHLYHLTTDTDKPQPDMLKLVVEDMRSHPESPHVHLLATACVFNLTTRDLAEVMPVRLMSATVTQLLHAMETFPNIQQVQSNCLMALCNDYLLQNVPFDRYSAAMLVIKWLSNHEEPTLQRIAVAIISILVAKQLLTVVQHKAMLGLVDPTLKFALSALWNLTDETPTAARNFIECQGLELYMEVLESYYSETAIQQKVLGLLNNIAEVEELQPDLMDEDLLEHILSLLQDSQMLVEVRYFAGGILAQLASREEAWTLDQELRSTILEQLHKSIMTWPHLEQEMVSYRSFRPFCSLLQTYQPSGVQLWAVWAIHLVCRQNASYYIHMLTKEGLMELLKALDTHPDTHSDVKRVSQSILRMVQEQQSPCEVTNSQTEPGKS